MVQLQINGEERTVNATSLSDLLRELELPPRGIAVAVNNSVIRRDDHPNYRLQPGDRIEIIRAVQGG